MAPRVNVTARVPIMRDTAVATAAGALVLLASLANFLGHNEYPLMRPEVGLAALALVAVAVAVGLLYTVIGSLGRMLLQQLLAFVALDINFGFTVALIGMVVMALVLRRRMMPFLGVAAGVVLLTQLAGAAVRGPEDIATSVPATAARSGAPLLVHVVLDEHIGIEGLLGDSPAVVAMRDKLTAFYTGNGFRLFGGAYSRYFHTVNSIPDVLNFGVPRSQAAADDVTANAYFDRLGALGYRINVWQTDFLRYCDNAFVVSCRTRRAYDAHDLVNAPIPPAIKAKLLVDEMAKLSGGLWNLAIIYDGAALAAQNAGLPLPLYRLREVMMPTAVGALETIDALSGVLREASPGDAYFVHDLVPHHPFVLTAGCEVKQVEYWRIRKALGITREEREDGYFDQISCLLTRLQVLFDAVAASPAGDDAILVIHGDHGSRITDVDPNIEREGRFSDADLIAGHSTLFAVKAPGIAPGYDPRREPIARLVAALADTGFTAVDLSPNTDLGRSVILENREAEPMKPYPLPAWWTDPR